MIKRMSLLGAALVAIVLIANLLRGQPPPTEESAPSDVRAVDPAPASPSAEPAGPATLEQRPNIEPALPPPAIDDVPSPVAAPRKFERRFMFDCVGEQFFVRIGDGQAALLPGLSLTGHWIALTQVGSVWRGALRVREHSVSQGRRRRHLRNWQADLH